MFKLLKQLFCGHVYECYDRDIFSKKQSIKKFRCYLCKKRIDFIEYVNPSN